MTGTKALITVVTTAWDDIEAVKRTCASVAGQSRQQGVSHLLVEGASSDGAVVAWYRANPPLPSSRVVSGPHEDIYDALNQAIREADGEYIVYLNAGDLFADPGVLERNVARLQNCPFRWGFGRARAVSNGAGYESGDAGVPYSERAGGYGHRADGYQAVVMSKAFLIELGGFDRRFGPAADYQLLLSAGKHVPGVSWSDLDIEFEPEGRTGVDLCRNLFARHRARVEVYRLGAAGSAADWLFTACQLLQAWWCQHQDPRPGQRPEFAVRAGIEHPGVAYVGRVPVIRTTLNEAATMILTRELPAPRHIHFTNAYSVALSAQDCRLAEAFQTGYCFPDGMPLTWALRHLDPGEDWDASRRIRGPEIFPLVLDRGRAIGARHFLLGSTEQTLARLQAGIATAIPGAVVAGAASPPFLPVDEVDWQQYLRAISESGAEVVWIGLGTPKQDFVARLLADLDPERTYLAVGAAFDFVAGTLPTAPEWMQRRGLEWVFRLASEPRRLWRRYLFGNSKFIGIVLSQWFWQHVVPDRGAR